jgi:hypothetical protein
MSATGARRAQWLIPLAALAAAACEDSRATFFEPVGPLSFNSGLTPTPARLPSGTVTIVGTDSVVVDVSWLRALQGGAVYQIWGVTQDPTTLQDTYTPLFGSLTEDRLTAMLDVNGDTIRDVATENPIFATTTTTLAAAGASTYGGSDSTRELVTRAQFILSTTDPANGGVNPVLQEAIVITIQPSGATTPSDSKILWRRIAIGLGGALSFGNFGGSDQFALVSRRDYVFGAAGAGTAGVRGPEVAIRLLNLARPPVGYYYRGVLVDTLGNKIVIDTLRSDYSGITAESRVSLLDADVNPLLPGMNEQGVLVGNVRNCATGSTENGCQGTLDVSGTPLFGAMLTIQLLLEPKLASVAAGQSVVLSAAFPETARQ